MMCLICMQNYHMKTVSSEVGQNIGGRNTINLRHADDSTSEAKNDNNLKHLLKKFSDYISRIIVDLDKNCLSRQKSQLQFV